MESNTSLVKIILTYGLLAAAVLFILGLIYYVMELSFFNFVFLGISVVITFGILIAFSVFGTRSYREKLLGGKINYGKKLLSVFLIILLGLVVSSILNFAFYELVDPDYMARQADEFMISMEERGMSDAQLQQIEEQFKEGGLSPADQLVNGLKWMPVMALVISLIVAATIKSDTTLPKESV
ncbi:MAG: DUF4199 domain-containing protein [bacterium]